MESYLRRAAAENLSVLQLGKTMQPKLANRDESAWAKGDLAYDFEDTIEIGIAKAAKEGIKSGSNEYAAFVTAFGRRVRSKQVSPRKAPARTSSSTSEVTEGDSAVVLTPDFSRAAS
jgi:hypothetical protein